MTITPFKGKIPEPRKPQHDLRAMLNEFMVSNNKHGEIYVDKFEYKNVTVAYSCLQGAVKRHGSPIKVMKRGKVIYLERTDI